MTLLILAVELLKLLDGISACVAGIFIARMLKEL